MRKWKKSKVKSGYDREENMDKNAVKFNSRIIHQELRLGIQNVVSSIYRILISQMSNLRYFILDNILILKNDVLFEL